MYDYYSPMIKRLANVDQIEVYTTEPDNSVQFMIDKDEFFIPLEGQIEANNDKEGIQKEIDRLNEFLLGVNKKLSSEKFLSNAPNKVVETEKKKEN